MKKVLILLTMIAFFAITIKPNESEARRRVRPCGNWEPDATSAVNNGAHITNSNQQPEGTYITVSIDCEVYDGGCAPTCYPRTVTMTHVYFYPIAS